MLRNKTDWDPAIMAKVTSSYKGGEPKVEIAQNASSVPSPKEKTLTESPEPVERVVASKPKERSSRATSSLTGNVKKPGRKVVIDAAEAKVRKPSRRAVAT